MSENDKAEVIQKIEQMLISYWTCFTDYMTDNIRFEIKDIAFIN